MWRPDPFYEARLPSTIGFGSRGVAVFKDNFPRCYQNSNSDIF